MYHDTWFFILEYLKQLIGIQNLIIMNKPNKAEQIEAVCSAVLDQEKANPMHAEIVIKMAEVLVKIKGKIIGRVVDSNGAYNFEYDSK